VKIFKVNIVLSYLIFSEKF